MQYATIDRSGRESVHAFASAEVRGPMVSIRSRAVAILPMADGRHSLMIDGQSYGIAASAELLEPALRLLGGNAA